MLGILLIALLASPDAAPLDGPALRQAMETATANKDASALIGKRFRVVVPFTDQRTRKYKAFKQSARWDYDGRKKVMTTTIGLGEITDRNFDTFKASKLDALPPLQSLYFDVDAQNQNMVFTRATSIDHPDYYTGVSTRAVSFGLAIPYQEGGRSAMPEGFHPLVVNQMKGSSDEAARWASTMSVVFEGEITSLGQQPEVFCGAYRGQMSSTDVTGDARMVVQDKQCFVTARIDRVEVVRRSAVLTYWRNPPKNPF
ncbi:hypothetical protein [Caulobacter sp. RHG1]|uniref:hypothetical protein n=1 Tax=Caulobacter sp. (strain RHG1) TaxID=2545762 RepID=UPI0015538C4B|nr:hypothetical protein [Caulobacter sp. RHG1]NQE65227.1 hypothetical protein [Caulobacter sp. RHG1]